MLPSQNICKVVVSGFGESVYADALKRLTAEATHGAIGIEFDLVSLGEGR